MRVQAIYVVGLASMLFVFVYASYGDEDCVCSLSPHFSQCTG